MVIQHLHGFSFLRHVKASERGTTVYFERPDFSSAGHIPPIPPDLVRSVASKRKKAVGRQGWTVLIRDAVPAEKRTLSNTSTKTSVAKTLSTAPNAAASNYSAAK